MLGDGHHVLAVMEQAAAGLRAGQVWAQTTTAGVDQGDLLAFAEKHGLLFVDAPVAGTRQPAESGQLVVLAAGSPDARAAVQPVFDAIGRATTWVADDAAGLAASRLKLVVDSWVLAVTAATAESIALARGLGVDPKAFLDSVAGGPLDLPLPAEQGAGDPHRGLDAQLLGHHAAKDADLIGAAARGAGIELDVAAAVAARMHRAADAGHGDADMAANYLASFRCDTTSASGAAPSGNASGANW